VCSAEWGTAIAPSAVEEALASMPTPHSVWLVHSETSTGVTLDLQGIAEVIQNAAPKALLCVDAVTSVGIHTLPMDAWSLDAVMTGSQKGLCAPPGLGVVALSQRARLYAQQQPATTTILHLPTIIESLQTCGMFPWTPPVTVVAALQAALSEIRAEGHDATWDKHRRVTKALHDGLRQRGFHLYGQGSSHAVSVVQHPSPKPFLETVRRDFGITLAAGQDQLSDTVFRIGTCGGVTVSDVLHLLDVLQRANNSLSTT
jgi:aspartate aminotransferase-like enzyme